MANLNYVDYIILAILLLSTLGGFIRGFVREMIALVMMAAGFVLATLFSETLAAHFTKAAAVQSAVDSAGAAVPVSYVAVAASFVLIFLATILVGAIIGYIINLIFQGGVLGFANRLMGAIFGLVRGFIFSLVLVFLVQLTAFSEQPVWQESQLVANFQPAVTKLADVVSPTMSDLKQKLNDAMTAKPA